MVFFCYNGAGEEGRDLAEKPQPERPAPRPDPREIRDNPLPRTAPDPPPPKK